MPYYPRSRNTERGYRNARTRGNPYVYRKPVQPASTHTSTTDTHKIPSLMSVVPTTEIKDASISNLKPIIPANETKGALPSNLKLIIPTKDTEDDASTLNPKPTIPAKETKDACTQTITKDKNLDPINFARLYVNSQISAQTIEEKRAKFFEDTSVNENIRKSYLKYIKDNNNNDDKNKLTKVNRKYHLIDHTLNTKILQMTPDQLKSQYAGIGWDFLGLQARMEFQRFHCSQLSEGETDEKFFQDREILTNLKIGYSRWKSENISSGNPTVMHINKSAQLQSESQLGLQIEDDDVIPVAQLLPDPTLNTDILSMSLEEISATYGSLDLDLLGLQARMEYTKTNDYDSRVTELIHNTDIDFMLDEQIPQIVRSWYRKWLSNNQLIKRQDELFVVKLSNKVDNPNSPAVSN